MALKRAPISLTIILIIGILVAGAPAFAQTGGRSANGDAKQSAPKVLLRSSLDPAYFQKEIAFVNYVQTEAEAQVLVEITSRKTDAGEEFSVSLTGQKEFAGINDVLKYTAAPNMTPDEAKPEVARLLKLGLLRYVSKTPIAGRINLAFMDQVKPTAVVDPWNFWVFSLSVDAFLNGEQSYKMRDIFGNFSASRVTPEWKLRFSVSGSSSKSTFSVGDYNYESTSESLNFNSLVVKSISDHWSIGASLGMSSSTYSNIKLIVAPSVAVEYDFFPYSESTKRQLRILYSLGVNFGRYRELTIYDKMKENHLRESLDVTLELKQPWGTISTSLDGSHYFYDLKKNRLSLNGELSVRIWKGLNFNFSGGGSRIHDQIFLTKGEATLEEVLLQRRQLETTYNYFFSVGLSFSFGSIYSNVVNPRFGSGSGTSISIQM
ncbi:MAG: hypothetical protein NTU60_09330 [Candidatus Aminicenantes bacterium]|nr:hypothetical protein [Candidatus Aminicenantes bacterium]